MARNPRPDQAITDRWAERLTELSSALDQHKRAAKDAQTELHDAIRAAFSEGVLVGTIVKATGLSGSRVFQIKFELRDRQSSSSPNSA